MSQDLQQQRAVVVGGTSGIGFATAELLAAEGAHVTIVGRRVDAALERLPEGVEGYVADVRDEAALRDVFAQIGPFDHLAFTAGEPLTIGAIADTDLDAARTAFETRVWGAYRTVKHAHRRLRPGGSIVLSSGSAGMRPQPTWTVAASVCGAVEALTRALAVELAPLRVNAIAPGVVRTDLWAGLSEDDRAGLYATAGDALLTGRVGEAEDVARAIASLMGNSFATGTVLRVDGGTMLV